MPLFGPALNRISAVFRFAPGMLHVLSRAGCRYTLVSDATKAMQQLDQMEIADQKIGVKIAPMSAQETAQLAAAASRVDLDDEGASPQPVFHLADLPLTHFPSTSCELQVIQMHVCLSGRQAGESACYQASS